MIWQFIIYLFIWEEILISHACMHNKLTDKCLLCGILTPCSSAGCSVLQLLTKWGVACTPGPVGCKRYCASGELHADPFQPLVAHIDSSSSLLLSLLGEDSGLSSTEEPWRKLACVNEEDTGHHGTPGNWYGYECGGVLKSSGIVSFGDGVSIVELSVAK